MDGSYMDGFWLRYLPAFGLALAKLRSFMCLTHCGNKDEVHALYDSMLDAHVKCVGAPALSSGSWKALSAML